MNKSCKSEKYEFETEWVEIINTKGANVLSAVIYNHPRRDPSQFLDYLNVTLKKLMKEHKLIILSGDYNLDLFSYDKRPVVENFLNSIFANFLQSLIFINSIENNAWSGNLISKISDHMPNFVILNKNVSEFKCVSQFKCKFKQFNENDFISEINSTDLLPHNLTDLEEKFKHFQENILESINQKCPFRKGFKKASKAK